jgi:hypothetical protein
MICVFREWFGEVFSFLLLSILMMLTNWILLCPIEKRPEFNRKLEKLRKLATSLPCLPG